MSTRPCTTLADLLAPRLIGNPFFGSAGIVAVEAEREFEDGLTHGGHGWLRGRPGDSFFPPCCFEPAILEERIGDHGHERMPAQALPGSAVEVIEPEFFFQLLVR